MLRSQTADIYDWLLAISKASPASDLFLESIHEMSAIVMDLDEAITQQVCDAVEGIHACNESFMEDVVRSVSLILSLYARP